ncbi:MAG: sigma-54 dependent transcriptional regulator, partial [Kangiellaceae bacterium]|nr:sigma-54 dependent transcriptional regulator [Kangiellaceae bacterium]
MKDKTILVVDDDPDILIAAELLLKRQFGNIITCGTPQDIPAQMARNRFDAILLDMNFSPGERDGAQGFNWLKRIKELDPSAVVVMITAHGNVGTAVEAIKYGATDFVSKPWQNEKLIATLSAAVELHDSRTETSRLKVTNQALLEAATDTQQSLLGQSKALSQVHSLISRTAPTDANVLILGENGTGKELVARELHRQSQRKNQLFMSVDMGAITESLFESEMFGHVKGAFTGANKDRTGRLVAANKGTLFLDEIGNIPLHLQAKLLTVLEQRMVTPVGSNQASPIDVRVIAATNVSKQHLQDEQRFRQDLLYRLNTVEILVPPLRNRREDILEIAVYYAQKYAKKYSRPLKRFSDGAVSAMKQDAWPGNVRSLKHAIERATILSQHQEILVQDLQLANNTETKSAAQLSNSTQLNNSTQFNDNEETETYNYISRTLGQSNDEENLNIESMEKRLIKKALDKHEYNISKSASELGIT